MKCLIAPPVRNNVIDTRRNPQSQASNEMIRIGKEYS
jgi:hypothetical protein